MKYPLVIASMVVMGMVACSRDTAAVSADGKSEGPPVNMLSHDRLGAVYRECTEYGPIDDPKVKYTVRYCASIQARRLSEGYTAPGTAKVDPTLNKSTNTRVTGP